MCILKENSLYALIYNIIYTIHFIVSTADYISKKTTCMEYLSSIVVSKSFRTYVSAVSVEWCLNTLW